MAGVNEPNLIEVRATVNLPKLAAGQVALVNPTLPYIRELLEARWLVPLERQG